MPSYPPIVAITDSVTTSDNALLDADEEEVQFIGRVCLAAGSGSKTFGTSGSSISWLPGASITFAADAPNNPTLTVGIKKSTTIDTTTGNPVRATIGAAAFDVSKALVGGTDTITSTTWREDSMASGSGFTVAQGDILAVCFHLDKPGAAAQSIKVRVNRPGSSANAFNFPATTLITSGPTFVAQSGLPNIIIKFDDGTLGWLDSSYVMSSNNSEAVGNGNIYGNVFTFPFACVVDAISALVSVAGTTNPDIGLWSDPNGTPTAMTNGTLNFDPQTAATTALRSMTFPLPAEVTLSANTAYAVGIKQNAATGMTVCYSDFAAAGHMQANGLDSTCYAAKSTGGAAFSAQNSGLRRSMFSVRISQLDSGSTSSGAPFSRIRTGM